ncbi:hypothetical protein PVL29_011943 [Vitis rotundifolia]|uniref:Uncharacterized protein n=1 Tax=Vitis rotundifolia TaxID=103349 RepID=A0AA38ZRF9_VITRO|nr:hypothetical protein PVL29_011943 [Vitis rotundifolia]
MRPKAHIGLGLSYFSIHVVEEVIESKHRLLTTSTFKLGQEAPTNHLVDNLGIISTTSEIKESAAKVDSSGGVYFVSAFNGLFTPWWRDDARGSMCFQVKDVLHSLHEDAGEKGEVKNDKGEFLLRVMVVQPLTIF